MKVLQTSLTLLFSIILLCCHFDNSKRDFVFAEAERLLENAPDSALVFLENTDILESLNRKGMIEYHLLLFEALDKNDSLLSVNGSILDEMLERLSPKKDAYLFTKALFYKGRVAYELRNYKEAIDFFLQGIETLPKEKKFAPLLSKLYSNLALAYFEHDLFDYALENYRISHQFDLQVQNQQKIALSLRNIGWAFLAKGEPDSTYFYFDQALDIAVRCKDDKLLDMIYNDLVYYYREIEKDYKKAIATFYNIKNPTDNILANIGDTYLAAQNMDSARFYLSKGIEGFSIEARAVSYYSLANLERSLKNYEASTEYLHQCIDLADSIYMASQNNEVERIIYKNKLDSETLRIEAEHTQKMTILVFVFAVVVLIILFLYYASNRKKKIALYKAQNKLLLLQQELREQNDEIDALNNSISRVKDKLSISKERASNLEVLVQRKKEIENRLVEHQQTIFKEKKGHRMLAEFMKPQNTDKKSLNSKEQKQLQKDVFSSYAVFINQLKMECPALTEIDILFCCLIKLGVQYGQIHLLFGYPDSNTIRQRKSVVKTKMLSSENPCEDLYYSIFSEKS